MPVTIINSKPDASDYKLDLLNYRELFYFLAWRDIIARYKQTALGVIWNIAKPVAAMAVFTLIFSKIARLPSDNMPYPLMVFSAMLPWQFFSNSLSWGSSSLVSNAALIGKIYFPRIIVPAATIIVALVDFLISLAVFAVFMFCYKVMPGFEILLLPVFIAITAVFSLGLSFFFSALSVKYRDVGHLVPFLLQLGFYISPVGFSSALIPEHWRLIYSLNPLTGIIEGFRWALLGGQLRLSGIIVAAVVSVATLVAGWHYFRRTEDYFADAI